MFKRVRTVLLVSFAVAVVFIVGQLVHANSVIPYIGIKTIAGSDSIGDGLPARYALFTKPSSIKYTSSGEMFIADSYKIRKISSNGQTSTIVGTGEEGDSGDGDLAVNAQIGTLYALDVNSVGEVIFSDNDNYKVKKIFINGTLTTIARNVNVIGVAYHPLTGEVYFSASNVINKIDSDGNIVIVAGTGSKDNNGDGPALTTNLYMPSQMVFNVTGDLYFVENTNRIRKLSNGQITTIVNSYIDGISIRPGSSDLVFVDANNYVIRLISVSSGNISTIAGTGTQGFGGDGGLATDAMLNEPGGVSYSPNGDLHIADTGNKRIRKVSAADGTISTYSGALFGDGYQANQYGVLNHPKGVSVNFVGEVIIADTENTLIRKVSLNGSISTIAGLYGASFTEGILAISSGLTSPYCVLPRPNGDVFIADRSASRIRLISANSGKISTIIGNDDASLTTDGTLANETSIGAVQCLIFNSQDELIFSDGYNRIRKVLSNGTVVTVAGIGYHSSGLGSFSGDGGLAVDATLNYPSGLIITASDDIIFIDASNNRIRIVYSNGTINTIAGNGNNGNSDDGQLATESALDLKGGIAMNSLGEIIFTDGNRVRKLFNNGTLTTIAGSQDYGFSGDGQLAINAQLGYPNVFVSIFLALNGNECVPTCFGISSVSSKVCSGYGQCNETDTCICTSPYYGSNCELFDCNGIAKNSSLVCSGRGTCQSPEVCSCQTGYYGTNCESFNCSGIDKNSSYVCSTHGTCQSPNNCSCQSEYFGANCELFNCYGIEKNLSNVCSSHGTCNSPNNCTCETGYYGSNCELFNCNEIAKNSSQVCSGRGTCQSPNNCSCQSPYYGANCESFSCSGIDKNSLQVCSSHGSCIGLNNCTCQSGYFGSNCESFNCSGIPQNSSIVCSSHGTCQSPNNCSCQSGYYGTNCESFNCTGIKSTESNVCSSRGQCTAPNTCKCSSNAFGSNCEFTVTSSLTINATSSQLTAISQVKLNNAFKNGLSSCLLIVCLLIALFQFEI